MSTTGHTRRFLRGHAVLCPAIRLRASPHSRPSKHSSHGWWRRRRAIEDPPSPPTAPQVTGRWSASTPRTPDTSLRTAGFFPVPHPTLRTSPILTLIWTTFGSLPHRPILTSPVPSHRERRLSTLDKGRCHCIRPVASSWPGRPGTLGARQETVSGRWAPNHRPRAHLRGLPASTRTCLNRSRLRSRATAPSRFRPM